MDIEKKVSYLWAVCGGSVVEIIDVKEVRGIYFFVPEQLFNKDSESTMVFDCNNGKKSSFSLGTKARIIQGKFVEEE